uniref:Ovule protein n=1 Tax=Echinococcus granulosus TaxID=6210 RepID=A0A068WUA1_ECHGR|nr:hypothetical protein EgrG_000164200 [Echinococcus granulosus]
MLPQKKEENRGSTCFAFSELLIFGFLTRPKTYLEHLTTFSLMGSGSKLESDPDVTTANQENKGGSKGFSNVQHIQKVGKGMTFGVEGRPDKVASRIHTYLQPFKFKNRNVPQATAI